MISKIKLKIHVLGNKVLFLSHYQSLAFVFFLFLLVTCKYGSHNSPLNNTRSHEIYGWSRASGFGCPTSLARGKSVRNHLNASVTSSSRAVHGPHTGKKLENLWVIPRHAVRARKIFRRFLDLYGRHRALN